MSKPLTPEEFFGKQVGNLLRNAKEKHLPVLIESEDGKRAIYVKDINSLNPKITINGKNVEEL